MSTPTLLRETWSGLLDLVYPPRCLVCREFGPEILCAPCRADFCPLDPPLCDRCGEMIAPARLNLCPRCEKGAFYFRQARAAGRFDGALRQAILRLKYGGRRRLSEPLGQYLAEFLRTDPFDGPPPDLLIPTPLHASRMRQRGFNQSALLAHVVGRELNLPVVGEALVRARKTRPQVEMRAAERQKNVRDAFAAPRPELVMGKVVLLLDDVLTTLFTADECARVLTAAGAKAVFVTGVARGL